MNIRVMLTVAILTATTLPALAQDRRQEDKNLMRNLGLGLGVAALNEARKGNSNKAVLLGAGALYAGKKYEDQRRNQNWDDDRGRWSRADRWDRDRFDNRRDNDDCRIETASTTAVVTGAAGTATMTTIAGVTGDGAAMAAADLSGPGGGYTTRPCQKQIRSRFQV
jgi:hypothetical protein